MARSHEYLSTADKLRQAVKDRNPQRNLTKIPVDWDTLEEAISILSREGYDLRRREQYQAKVEEEIIADSEHKLAYYDTGIVRCVCGFEVKMKVFGGSVEPEAKLIIRKHILAEGGLVGWDQVTQQRGPAKKEAAV